MEAQFIEEDIGIEPTGRSPEQKLALAMLECAVKDYLEVRGVRDDHWETARAWLFDDQPPPVRGDEYLRLIDVADALDQDVERIRKNVRLIEAGELVLGKRKRA